MIRCSSESVFYEHVSVPMRIELEYLSIDHLPIISLGHVVTLNSY